ncbi:Ppx/GppA family phosphatase [Bacillus shivajii]|uniref:Ppx/GppA family phosphatase n=1 Tax=Bacillus shivajii TaxID=1983719 RepID=UPI001CFB6F1E|nr:Ppx/GppA family phosphatase [Bacillus shivajii]UCZ54528.1 Ppx/GppA family phosphatase [Bacillus shivajii]
MQHQIGIIDMGSNSIRFVIYSIDANGCFKEIQNLKVVARLSTYIDENKNMTEDGIDIILETLERFKSVVSSYSLSTIKGVATAAIRNAKNQQDILAAIKAQGYFDIKVLSDEQEAYYGYLAITNSTNILNGITIDIGGGSTEVTLYENRKLINSHSFPFGALTLKQRFIKGNEPSQVEMEELKTFLQQSFASLPWLKNKSVPIIGIGGTARNLASIHQHIIDYPITGLHQYEMTYEDVISVNEKLNNLTLKQRQQVDGLSKDRADIIIPAITAIENLISYSNGKTFTVSNKGLRDGLFYEIYLNEIAITHFPNVTEESFYQLSHLYSLNIHHHQRIAVLATYFATQINQCLGETFTKKDFKMLRWGAKIFYIGETIHPESKSEHSFYLITNQSIDGLTHLERLGIAFIASFKSRSQMKQFANPFRHWVTTEELEKYELLGAIVRFCHALNISNRYIIEKLQLTNDEDHGLLLTIYSTGDAYFEYFYSSKYKKHIERALKKKLSLQFKRSSLQQV